MNEPCHRRVVKRLSFYLCFIAFGLCVLPFNALCMLSCLLPGRRQRVPWLRARAARLLRLFIWGTTRAGIMRFEFRGLEYAEQTPRLIIANHTGLLDALLLFARYPHFTCIYKQALARNPCFSHIPKALDFIPNRPSSRMLSLALEHLRKGEQLLVFPEGTRSPQAAMGRFSPGFLSIARLAGVPMAPLVIENPQGVLAKDRGLLDPVALPIFYRFTLFPETFSGKSETPALERAVAIESWFREKLSIARFNELGAAGAIGRSVSTGEIALVVPEEAPCLRAHFPGNPIVPGAVLLGWMGDVIREVSNNADGPLHAVNTKFLDEVPPGAALVLRYRMAGDSWETELLRHEQPVARARFKTTTVS
ncbi:MAG: 1-acyl-sn-glycerol-3-phosphate acyltransferase [Opitutales bacterium]